MNSFYALAEVKNNQVSLHICKNYEEHLFTKSENNAVFLQRKDILIIIFYP